MAAKSSVQPECMVGTSTENKWNTETKSSTKESDPTPRQLLLKENVCLLKSKTQNLKIRPTNDVVDSLEQIIKIECQHFEEQVERRRREKLEMYRNFMEILKASQKNSKNMIKLNFNSCSFYKCVLYILYRRVQNMHEG